MQILKRIIVFCCSVPLNLCGGMEEDGQNQKSLDCLSKKFPGNNQKTDSKTTGEETLNYPEAWKKMDISSLLEVLLNTPGNPRNAISETNFGKWLEALHDRFEEFNANAFSNSLYSIVKLNKKNKKVKKWFLDYISISNQTWLEDWYKQSNLRFAKFKPATFANILSSFGSLEFPPDQGWLQAWYNQSKRRFAEFKPEHFSNTLYALGKLGIMPHKDWLQAWYSNSQPHLASFSSKNLILALYAHALLEIVPWPAWYTPAKEILEARSINEINDLRQICIFNQSVRLYRQESQKDFLISLQLDPEQIQRFLREPQTISQLEDDIILICREVMGKVLVERQYWIEAILGWADFYIPSTKTVILVDGPRHFLRNKELNPKTQLYTRILKKNDYNVVRIPYFEWNENYADGKEREYIKQRLALKEELTN